MKPKHHILPLGALSGLALFTGSASLNAQTAWDGGGGDTDYSNNLNWDGDIIPGDGNANGASIGNSLNQTVVYSTAISYTSTGTLAANSLRVGTGTGGIGSLTLNGSAGTLTFGGNGYANAAWIGSDSGTTAATTGTVTVSAGKLAIGTGAGSDASINLGVNISSGTGVKSGTLLINGGTVEVGRRILMGANNATSVGLLTLSSGTLDMKRTGSAGEGDLGMIRLGNGTNTVNFDGGNAILSGLHVSGAASARSTINFNGTTLKANATTTDFIVGTTANANLRLKNGGLVMDTNTFDVTINDALTQVTGEVALLRKEGVGTLTITGAQASRTGTTAVNGGTLRVSGTGSLGTGATTVNGSGSILDLNRNDTWGGHSGSVQALSIQSGGLVTNGTAIDSGFNTVQTLSLDGGELRVTGTARAVVDGGLFKFEAYAIRDSVTVTGTAASSITNPTSITNAGINIGGFSDLGGGVGSSLSFVVADVTGSSAADLTVSAVLKNNYTSAGFLPLSNGLTKSGAGTMVLSAVNAYTGLTTVSAGTLALGAAGSIDNTSGVALGGGTLDVSAKAGAYVVNNLTGNGAVIGSISVSTQLAIGSSPGTMSFESLTLGAASTYLYELTGGGSTADLGNVSNTLTLNGGTLDLVQLGTYTVNNKFTLFGYQTGNLTGTFAGLADGDTLLDDMAGLWKINYADTSSGLNGGTGTSFVTVTAIREPSAAILGALGTLVLLRRRR